MSVIKLNDRPKLGVDFVDPEGSVTTYHFWINLTPKSIEGVVDILAAGDDEAVIAAKSLIVRTSPARSFVALSERMKNTLTWNRANILQVGEDIVKEVKDFYEE